MPPDLSRCNPPLVINFLSQPLPSDLSIATVSICKSQPKFDAVTLHSAYIFSTARSI